MSIVTWSGEQLACSSGFTGSLSGNKVNRNSVFFKFASEGYVEKIEFLGKEIAVGDLRQAIADQKNIRKFDVVIENEATGEVYDRDGKMLPRNISVTVRRCPLHKKTPAVVHVENTDIWTQLQEQGARPKVVQHMPIQRRACPAEYLCDVCGHLYSDACIARCCGRSACVGCFPSSSSSSCPLCSREWTEETRPIPNPRLRDSVKSLDLDYFDLPGQPARCKQEKELVAAVAGQPVPDSLAPQTHWAGNPPPIPQGVTVRPCMLSPEQFLMWQRSVKNTQKSDSSSGDGRKKKRKRKEKEKGKSKRKKTKFQ